MLNKNLRYYRLKSAMSKKEVAESIHVTPMAITHYENGDRVPNMETIKALADVFEVRVSDFLMSHNLDITYQHEKFRKNAALTKTQQEYVYVSVEDHFDRFMTAVEILGGEVLPEAPRLHQIPLREDDEENARMLRLGLGFAEDGPIEDIIGKLENKGILIYECDVRNNKFSGLNGLVNERPYIAFNAAMTPERNRSTMIHELSHLMFSWPDDISAKDEEVRATAISGAFLFPKKDVVRELGVRRSAVSSDMILVAKEYGISMMLLAKRAEQCGIISPSAAKDFYIQASKIGWRTAEPSRIVPEKPTLFRQLVYRAVNEENISFQRGAELLGTSYDEIAAMCHFGEV